MTVEKNMNGSYVISDIKYGVFHKQVYYGYTKKESIKKFKDHYKNLRLLINESVKVKVK